MVCTTYLVRSSSGRVGTNVGFPTLDAYAVRGVLEECHFTGEEVCRDRGGGDEGDIICSFYLSYPIPHTGVTFAQ